MQTDCLAGMRSGSTTPCRQTRVTARARRSFQRTLGNCRALVLSQRLAASAIFNFWSNFGAAQGGTSRVDSKSFIAGDDTILQAVSLCRKGRRSMQLSYAPILGYSFDSTKVAKPIRQPIRPESWSNWNGWNGETDGRNADPPKKSGR